MSLPANLHWHNLENSPLSLSHLPGMAGQRLEGNPLEDHSLSTSPGNLGLAVGKKPCLGIHKINSELLA
jgi:hypothetical protein